MGDTTKMVVFQLVNATIRAGLLPVDCTAQCTTAHWAVPSARETHPILCCCLPPTLPPVWCAFNPSQVHYNLLYRKPEENGVKAACDDLGVTLIAYSPLSQGGLMGRQ